MSYKMFQLPTNIQKLIYEFDSTYHEEYKKVLEFINKLPKYHYFIYDSDIKKTSYIYTRKIDKIDYFCFTTYSMCKYYFLFLRKTNY